MTNVTVNDVMASAISGDSVELEKNVADLLKDRLDTQVNARYDELEQEMLGDEDATDSDEDSDDDAGAEDNTDGESSNDEDETED